MAFTFSRRSRENLRGVHPDLVRVMERAIEISDLDFIVIEGLRTIERQRELVAQGASRTMNSRHITGHAVDLLPIGRDGRAAFDWPLYDILAPAVKRAADELGVAIVWGGDWRTFKDGPHFELDRSVYPATGSPAVAPVERRTSPAQSTTVQASAVQIATGAGAAASAVSALDGTAQIVALAFAGVVVLAGLWIMRERMRAWADGWR